ncbi:ABC transporter ATP-binding protein [Thermodesulfobacteriota bacterium B35]
MIHVDNLTRRYGDFVAVDRVSFEIGQGEIVGLLGHNGAGKTTIMKMLTGFLEPTEGRITIDGLDIATDLAQIQRRIGYLPENCPVYPEMFVVDYLDYAAALHSIPSDERPSRIQAAIARTGLEEKALQPISTLSRGYRQRVGVAQAILHEPEILILDEPTNGLDPTQIQQMRQLIRDLAKSATVIISTHILQEVQAVCSRVIIIRNGEKALDARLDELQADQRLRLVTDAGEEEAARTLAAVAGVDRVEATGRVNGHGWGYGLVLAEGADRYDVSARVAALLAEQGRQLYELRPEIRDLETIFGEISAREGRI